MEQVGSIRLLFLMKNHLMWQKNYDTFFMLNGLHKIELVEMKIFNFLFFSFRIQIKDKHSKTFPSRNNCFSFLYVNDKIIGKMFIQIGDFHEKGFVLHLVLLSVVL